MENQENKIKLHFLQYLSNSHFDLPGTLNIMIIRLQSKYSDIAKLLDWDLKKKQQAFE